LLQVNYSSYSLVRKDDADKHILPLISSRKAKLPIIVIKLSNDCKNNINLKVLDPPFGQPGFFAEHVPVVKENDLQVGSQDKIAQNPSTEEIFELFGYIKKELVLAFSF
jgi:hypothetical protein